LDKQPFTVSYKRNPATRQLIYYVSAVQEPDPELSGIVGDALHNLRSALDHIAYQLVMIGTGQTPSRRVYFPIWDSQAKYESEGRRQIEGSRAEAIALHGVPFLSMGLLEKYQRTGFFDLRLSQKARILAAAPPYILRLA
jgi:hypothetical protein